MSEAVACCYEAFWITAWNIYAWLLCFIGKLSTLIWTEFPLSIPVNYICYFTCISRHVITFTFWVTCLYFTIFKSYFTLKFSFLFHCIFHFLQTYINNVFSKFYSCYFPLSCCFLSTISLLFLLTTNKSLGRKLLRVKEFPVLCGSRIAYLIPSPQNPTTATCSEPAESRQSLSVMLCKADLFLPSCVLLGF